MSHITLSKRVQAIQPSVTLAISAQAALLRASGKDIISLGVGEPDFDTPENIKEAAKIAIDKGFTKYTAVDGTPELKQAIIDKFANENQLNYESQQIIVSCGAKQSLYNIMQALLDPDDEVIIAAPYWVSYPDMVLLTGAKPVIIETDAKQQFKISAEQLAQAITSKTRLFIINSPCNPSGMSYDKKHLQALGEVLLANPQVLVMSDDIYEHINFTQQPFANIVNACPSLYERSVVVNGLSKAYAMTGWRIGYAAGPAELIAAARKIQSQSTSNPNSITQKAAVEALTGDQSTVKKMCETFKRRHQLIYEGLNQLPGVNCLPADGTFYVFPDVSQVIANLANIDDDIGFADYLLDRAGIAVVPGTAFGTPGHVRLSFATSDKQLKTALDRLHATLS